MPHRSHRSGLILAAIFGLALVASGYLVGHLGPDNSPLPAGFLAADKGYGVNIDLTHYDDKALADTLAALRRNGLLWLRQPILWETIEPLPGHFNWAATDRIFAAVEHSNLKAGQVGKSGQNFKLIAVLHTAPEWARPNATPPASPPIEGGDFGNFARALAGRYGRQIDHYQIWHEPNLSATWGHTFVDPQAYANLLREAAINIRAVDAGALILSAALAPTLENGPLNLNEIEYLNQLYGLKANRWFDIVAGQPYGFDFDPAEPAASGTLNFKRLELLRQVMLNHDDPNTPIWATAFGWNALPPSWSGRPSPWRSDQDRYDPPARQAQRTAGGLETARQSWPWLGPVLAVRWDSTGLAEDDPARGFALAETPLQETFREVTLAGPVATIGRYPATHASGQYSPGWRTALTTADIPRSDPRTLTIPFDGTRLDLTINRGPYRGYLWVTIDGKPANALPQNNRGRSYVVLYDPLRESATVTLAQNLPPGPHTAVIEAEGGWGQWTLSGWTISNKSDNPTAQAGLVLAGVLAGLSGLGLVWQFFPELTAATHRVWSGLMRPSWPVMGHFLPGERLQVAIIFTIAIVFYLAPAGLATLLLLPLSLALLFRPDLGLALIAFSLSFFQAPRQLSTGSFLLTETTLILTAAGFGLRGCIFLFTGSTSPTSELRSLISNPTAKIQNLKALDRAALALLILGLVSTLAASNFGVSMFEWRVLVLGSVAYYFLVRSGRDYGPQASNVGGQASLRWAWRLVDAWVAGAAFHAAIVLYGYFLTDQFVVIEGVRRVMSPVYASPNNLSLFLDRAWPILLAVTLLPGQESSQTAQFEIRRWLYGSGLVVVSIALYLTFSKGALLLGLPAGVMAMVLFHLLRHRRHHWRQIMAVAGGSLVVLTLALIPLSQTDRFRTVFDFNQGSTGFFRLKVWQAALNMLKDHWPLGVGLDNFLYQYRTRYILPEAWQEPNLSHPHNIILDYGTRLGLGGVVLLFWLQGAFWVNAWRLYQRLPEPFVLGLMGSMVVFLSHGLIDNAYFLVDLAFIFFLSCGLVQRLGETGDDKWHST